MHEKVEKDLCVFCASASVLSGENVSDGGDGDDGVRALNDEILLSVCVDEEVLDQINGLSSVNWKGDKKTLKVGHHHQHNYRRRLHNVKSF